MTSAHEPHIAFDLELGEPLFSRLLHDESGTEVLIEFGRPQPYPDGKPFYLCPYRIGGGVHGRTTTTHEDGHGFGIGADELGALLGAINAVESIFSHWQATHGPLTWKGGSGGWHELPRFNFDPPGLAHE